MTIILPLEPQEEAKLIALAQEKGVTTDAFVRAAINAMLAEAGNAPVPEPFHFPARFDCEIRSRAFGPMG